VKADKRQNGECRNRRRHRLDISAFCVALSAVCVLASCGRREPQKYNVLLITLDTTRADHLGAYGDASAETPAIDRLAREGVRFENADSAVPLTLPAHATILSGLLPLHHTLRNNGSGTLPADRDTLATLFSRAGYRTGGFVGSFVLDHRFGLNRGFDVYDDEIPRDPTDLAESLEAERKGEVVVNRALAWLDQADARPFFAWVHLYDAHAPYAPPEPYRSRFAGREYDGEIAYVDAQVARLLTDLERRGLRDKTIVAVIGDHGESLGEHGELTHGLLLYEATLHVPLIIAAPEVQPGVVRQPLSAADLAPTIAGLAGLALRTTDGRDLSMQLRDRDEPGPTKIYAETQYPLAFGWSELSSLRNGNVKLIAGVAPELYDLQRDPGEQRNVLSDRRREYRQLSDSLAALRGTSKSAPAPSTVDEETRAKLASLGYVAPGVAPLHGPPRDPKAMASLFRDFEDAHTLMQERRVDEALLVMQRLVAADPQNPVFRSSLARAWRQHGDIGRAIALYREALAQNPDDPEAWYNLAAAFQDAGEQANAGAAIAEALRRDPRRPEAHNVLGIALIATGEPTRAMEEFNKAIAIDPRNSRAYNNLGNVMRAVGRTDDAFAAYRRSAELAPRYPDPLNGLGVLLVQQGRPRDGLSFFDRALQLAPTFYEAQLNRGIALAEAGDRPAAAVQFRRLLALLPPGREFDSQRTAARTLLTRVGG
jgi:arylsulfatase A-like enzyme/Flp pilus assembly protein TadD